MNALAQQTAPRLRPAPFTPLNVSHERIIVLKGTHYNINLREIHDAIFGPPLRGVKVRFVLASGARILSRASCLPAVRTGFWPGDRS